MWVSHLSGSCRQRSSAEDWGDRDGTRDAEDWNRRRWRYALGTHFCLFYETKMDLLDTMISYCKTGLESEEFCLWVVAEPLTVEEAMDARERRGA